MHEARVTELQKEIDPFVSYITDATGLILYYLARCALFGRGE